MEEVGEEPRVEEGVLGAPMGMIEYHVIDRRRRGGGILDRGWVVMPLPSSMSTSTSLHSSARTAFTPCDILVVTPEKEEEEDEEEKEHDLIPPRTKSASRYLARSSSRVSMPVHAIE